MSIIDMLAILSFGIAAFQLGYLCLRACVCVCVCVLFSALCPSECASGFSMYVCVCVWYIIHIVINKNNI